MVRFISLIASAFFLLFASSISAFADDACSDDGGIYGVVEIGGKGVKAVVAQLLPSQNSDVSCSLKILDTPDSINPDPVVAAHLQSTLNAIISQRDAINGWAAQHNIQIEHIYYVLSSGVADLQKSQDPDDRQYWDNLRAAIARTTGSQPGVISADDEASLTFDSLANYRVCWRRSQVALIDIGSSNTKGSYLDYDAGIGKNCTEANYALKHRTFEIPWGTRIVQEKLSAQSYGNESDFEHSLDDLLSGEVTNDLDKIAMNTGGPKTSGFLRRERIYLAGGISYALATFTHGDNQNDFVPLTTREINGFYLDLKENPDCILKYLDPQQPRDNCRTVSRLSFMNNAEKDEVRTILTKIFPSRDQLLAGAGLLKTVSTEWGFGARNQGQSRRICFARQAIHGWTLGYLLQKVGDATDLPREDTHGRNDNSPGEPRLGRC